MRLPHTTLHAQYTITSPFRMPYHAGSMLRGVLGRSLRAVACASSSSCATTCAAPAACAYHRLFDPPPRVNSPHAARHGASVTPPPPLIPLIPATGGQLLCAGAEMAFGLRCLGRLSAADSDLLLRALERLDERSLSGEQGRVRFLSAGFVGGRDQALDVGESPQATGRLSLAFETPAWLERKGQLALDLDFPQLLRAAWRRLSTVADLYGEPGPADEETFRRLDALAAQVATLSRDLRALRWERQSDETGARHKMEGLIGSVEFAGPVGAFRSVLAAAQRVHLGKATSFGLGRLRATFCLE